MDAYDVCVCLLVMVGTMALTACSRELARRFLRRQPHARSFALELSGAFQICACTHELGLLGGLLPEPHAALALVYLFAVLHGLLLTGSVVNPASGFQLFFSNRSTVKAWGVQTCAQLLGALLANFYVKAVWALGTIPAHSSALQRGCSHPIQTTVAAAFVLELLFSFMFHLALKKLESTSHGTKVHLLALLITAIVFKGGHLTGAIFNPALAFSLHLSCFLEKFWNYTLVYWVAPCIGSVLVAVVWDEVIPHLRNHFNNFNEMSTQET